ncbi:uncharacterized protein LOC135394765 [Ornithodoros turicata]|uniref:uncharacterized protein LOC135394765 n=1 Tax=Ornithodoros turicata TaxID=34597 RepID=UPI003138D99E
MPGPITDLRKAAETLARLPVELHTAVLKTCVNICTDDDLKQKAASCNIPYENLRNAVDSANSILLSLKTLGETAVDQILNELPINTDLRSTIKSCLYLENWNSNPLGKIVDIKWKVSVIAMTDQCKNLNTPLVTFKLVVEQDGELKDHVMEFTVPEFEQFASTVEQMAAATEIA